MVLESNVTNNCLVISFNSPKTSNSISADDWKELKEKIVKFREDEMNHKDIAYNEGASKKGLYKILDNIIKTGSRVAIKISEKY